MSFALLATQNTTSMLILILTILLWLWLNNRDEAKRLKSFFVIIRNLIIVGAIGIILVFSQEQFRDRVLSSFGIGEAHGSSMNTRIFYLYGGIASFVANPMGYGFDDSKFPFPVSRDIYLLNLLVMVGIPVFIFYICIYIYPIVHGWKYLSLELIQKNPLRTVYFLLIGWVVSSLAIGVLSNSQTTQASPSNFLFWSAVGVMYKFPKLKSIPDN
jgi:hypothetical protein